jgi:tyrosine-protein kinase Etk/Wzc
MAKRKIRSNTQPSQVDVPVSSATQRPVDLATREPPAFGGVRPPSIRHRIRRNLPFVVACAGLAAIAAIIVTSRWPRRYEASVSIRVDPRGNSFTSIGTPDASSGNAMATEMEMLHSRSLIRTVVDSTGARLQMAQAKGGRAPSRGTVLTGVHVADSTPPGSYRIVAVTGDHLALRSGDGKLLFGLVQPGQRAIVRGLSFRVQPEAVGLAPLDLVVLPIDDAVDSVQAWTTVSRRSRDADMVDLRVRGPDASLVYELANALGREYIADHDEAHHLDAKHAVVFLRDQVTRVSRQLHTAERNLRDYRSRAGVISLPDEAATGVHHRAELQAQRNATNVEREALGRLLRSTGGSAGPAADEQFRHLLAFPTLLRSDAALGIQTALIAAEQKRSDLATRPAEQDAEKKAVDARISELRGQLRAFVSTYLQGLTNEVEALDATLSRSDQALATLPEKELRYAELDREAKSNESLYGALQQKLKEAELAAAAPNESVRLVDAAVLPRHPATPNPLLTILIAIGGGLFVGLTGSLLREYADHTLRTRSQLLALTGSPVLSLIPRLQGSRVFGSRLLRAASRATPPSVEATNNGAGSRAVSRFAEQRYATSDLFRFAESYARLVTNLGFAATEHPVKVLLVTSALARDGKTTVATNLALTLAREGRRVLLIDGDLRGGRIGGMLGLFERAGLSDTLLQQSAFADAVAEVPVDSQRVLHVLTRGAALTTDPSALLGSTAPGELIASVRERYDMIVVDTPPVNSVADAAMLTRHCDGVLLVARAGVTGRDALIFAMEQLRIVRAPLIGGVLNDVDLQRDAGVDGAYATYGRYPSGSAA